MAKSFTINITMLMLLVLMALFAVIPQFTGFINPDNAWLLHVAGRVVGGERLNIDVVETNPPLIVYIMMLPVYLAGILHISHIAGFIIFIFLISCISLALAFSQTDDWRLKAFFAFAIFILPNWAYGEREHIYLILTLPYLASLWGEKRPATAYTLSAGIMAATGFILKPYFLIIWISQMLVKMALDKKLFSFFNIQDIIIALAAVAYPLYLVFIEKTYMAEVFPLIAKYYSRFYNNPKDVLAQVATLGFLYLISFVIIYIKDKKILNRAAYFSTFAVAATLVSIIIQNRVWSNYLLPLHFFGLIANGVLCFITWRNIQLLWNKVAITISSFVVVVIICFAISGNLGVALFIKQGEQKKLTDLLNEKPGQVFYAINFDLSAAYPAVSYADVIYKPTYNILWMLPGLYHDAKKEGINIIFRKPEEMNDDEKKIINTVIRDLKQTPPQTIIVNEDKYYNSNLGNFRFDFVKYFSANLEFAAIWGNYKKTGQIGKRAVYTREKR